MSTKMYLHLLFFCGVFFQEIFATLSDKDTRSSSDFLVRKRRIIDLTNDEPDEPAPRYQLVQAANYVVKIRKGNRVICGGAILTHQTIITSASCVQTPESGYEVFSGGAFGNPWRLHNITSVTKHLGNLPHQPMIDGIALAVVEPFFVFNRNTGHINLYVGPILAGTHTIVFHWGHAHVNGPESQFQQGIRGVPIPILNHRECANRYRHIFVISEKHICTKCVVQHCNTGETGSPLVINNMLAGVHTWKGELSGQLIPDIFANLQEYGYIEWIRTHLR